jgi:quercetin dioxygenase-like cupin family protein
MAKSGDVLEHPVTRERIVIRKSARDTNGELFEVDIYLQPGGFVAAEHIHPLQEERFEVISGTLSGRVAGKELAGRPRAKIVVPPGAPHVWWNSGDTELHVFAEVRPALNFESFFETFFGLAQDGKVNPRTGLPNIFQMALVMRAYRNELILARPPRIVQTVIFGLLAPIGRLFGYKGVYPYPYSKRTETQTEAQPQTT